MTPAAGFLKNRSADSMSELELTRAATPERTDVVASIARGYWLAKDPSKRWAEKLYLAYTPVWIATVAIVQNTGWYRGWGDVGHLAVHRDSDQRDYRELHESDHLNSPSSSDR